MANITKVLADIVGSGFVSDADFETFAYSRDISPYPPRRADFIVLPANTEQVSEVMRYANQTKTPVYTKGGGSAFGGLNLARAGGIILDLDRMDKILGINEDSATVTMQAACGAYKVIKALRKQGRRLALWPEFGSTVPMGGWTSCTASGIGQYSHGFLWDSLVGLEVVLPTGEIVRTGANAWSNCGPICRYIATGDIQGMFTGSLGALGVITELTYTTFPAYQAIEFVDIGFDDIKPMISALKIFRDTDIITDVTYVDGEVTKDMIGSALPYQHNLSLACTGTPEDAERRAATVRELGLKAGGQELGVPLGKIMYDNASLLNTPAKAYGGLDSLGSCHAYAELPEMYKIFKDVLDKSKLPNFWYAWVLKTCFVSFPAFCYKEPEQWEDARRLRLEIYHKWMELKDATPGYYGPWPDFTPYLRPTYYDLLRKIKRALDPNNILQPGLLPY